MFTTTFVNQNEDNNIIEVGAKYCESILSDLKWYMENGDNTEDSEEQTDELPPFHEYGLCFDFVAAADTLGNDYGYYRYQICYGGPSFEFRIYENDYTGQTTIEAVYLNWFCGVGFDIEDTEVGKWIIEYFTDICMIDWDNIPYEDKVSPDVWDNEEYQ